MGNKASICKEKIWSKLDSNVKSNEVIMVRIDKGETKGSDSTEYFFPLPEKVEKDDRESIKECLEELDKYGKVPDKYKKSFVVLYTANGDKDEEAFDWMEEFCEGTDGLTDKKLIINHKEILREFGISEEGKYIENPVRRRITKVVRTLGRKKK